MAVRVPYAMSSGLSAGMAEVAAMSESVFCKRFRSSYESSPSVSPLDLPSRKRYRGTSELVEDSKEDNDEEDKKIKEIMDSDSMSEDAKDEGPTAEDEDPTTGDEGLTAGVEGPGMDDEGYGLDDESRGIDDEGHSVESGGLILEEEEAVPGGQQQAAPVVRTIVSAPLGLRYGALRHCFMEVLEYEQERVAVTFGAIWRPMLALKAWTGQTDAQRSSSVHVQQLMKPGREPLIYSYKSLQERDSTH
ncbi:hypothetical protein Tco_1092381 [Tanacetum coccineum]|uniref:Uncharacterized protein n=1 Tax=Tanacetum coccineum TaxID=301880 RepID=A0ABQ5IBX0_9ASTR